ncbi:unnamed protein product [Paramecium pentaurelia]|uniref:Uncharacterized protein n=1 Tax=Paramecium pentaurelia TaxID=43138 RepID=A0A8S1RZ47_9CILI|nr:unnamed protein product [Paramecium pentaurelia]
MLKMRIQLKFLLIRELNHYARIILYCNWKQYKRNYQTNIYISRAALVEFYKPININSNKLCILKLLINFPYGTQDQKKNKQLLLDINRKSYEQTFKVKSFKYLNGHQRSKFIYQRYISKSISSKLQEILNLLKL